MAALPKTLTPKEVKEIIARGYPAVENILPDLVLLLCNQNSGYMEEVADFLQSVGHSVVPHVKEALIDTGSSLAEWQSALIETQVKKWPSEWVADIEEELDDLAWYGTTGYDVDLEALELLAKNHLSRHDLLTMLIQIKKEICQHRLDKLQKITQYLNLPETDAPSTDPAKL